MLKEKLALTCAAAFSLLACCSCGGGDGSHFKLSEYETLPAIRLSSFYGVEDSGVCKVKYTVPETDIYSFDFSNKAVSSLELYDKEGKLIKASESKFEVALNKGETVYARMKVVKTAARITVRAKETASPLPFEIAKAPDPASFKTTSEDSTVDPLVPAQINYIKRDDTLYVYCNAPEGLTQGPQVVNKCITRQDISDQSVYFTMEQQSNGLSKLPDWNFPDDGVYYGYRVTNTGSGDLYITVRNVGWQLAGGGAFLGEKEWIDFYNTRFELPDFSDMTDRQKDLYKAYYNFAGNYSVHDFQPTTYRIPAGKYIYVLGGTTQDAFGGFGVAGTENDRSINSECANGAVLFDVVGSAEGAYYVYNDISKVMPGGEGYNTHMGITDPEAYGVVHTGEDVGYVVDNEATWTFNDVTPAQKLPVTFKNYYSDDAPARGDPNTSIPGTKEHVQERVTTWTTHIDVQQNHNAVGTDMTTFHTVNKNGDRIQVGCNYYDTRGEFPNIGNWMKDYQDLFTFVNQGNKEREITLNLGCNGAVVVLVRDMEGKRVPDSWTYSMVRGGDEHGDGFDKALRYKIKVPAHSVVQYVLEYNLMANSNGNVTHSVDLY